MRLRWVAGFAVALALLTACALPGLKPERQGLAWNGTALVGGNFASQTAGRATVHYAGEGAAETAALVATAADAWIAERIKAERVAPDFQAEIWMLPDGWPAGIPELPSAVTAWAPAPDHVLLLGAGATGVTDVAGLMARTGLAGALAVAARVERGLAPYRVPWLQAGMGAILAGSWESFPLEPFSQEGPGPRKPADAGTLFRSLTGEAAPTGSAGAGGGTKSGGEAASAATALAALLIDRWGIDWPHSYPRTPDQLTPALALRWATGAADDETAVRRWQERMNEVVGRGAARLGMVAAGGESYTPTAADLSPVRVQPKLARLPAGPGPNANYSPHAYAITARYEPELRRVAGDEQLTWTNGEGIPVDTLYFNLWPNAEQYAAYGGAITVTNAWVDGQPIADDPVRALDLILPLGRAVAPGESVTVTIRFVTTLPYRITLRAFGQTGRPMRRFNLAHWFPILAVLDDRGWNLTGLPTMPGEPYSETADFHVSLDVPAGVQVAATGHPAEVVRTLGRWEYRWDAPNVKDWVATGGRNLQELVQQAGDVTLHVIDSNEGFLKPAAAETARALALFGQRWGPYGYKDLVVTCCNGLEYPGLFYTMSADSRLFALTTYHELAHQWFYGMVGNDQYGEPWLDEGFARYGERLGLKAFGPEGMVRKLNAVTLPPSLHVSDSSGRYATALPYYAVGVYDWGALALEDLEASLGRQAFDRLMQEWVRRYRFRTATTADFVALAGELSGRDLSAFFREHRIDGADRRPYQPLLPLGKSAIGTP